MDSKIINEELMSALLPLLESNGFYSYKDKKFIKIENEIIYFLHYSFGKNDPNVWYSCYPIFQYKIWFGAGFMAGRMPPEENKIKISNIEDLNYAINVLKQGFADINDFFKNNSSIEIIERGITDNSNIFLKLLKAYCQAYMGGDMHDAKSALEAFLRYRDSGDWADGASALLASFSDGTTKALLEKNKQDNIKNLRLKKFMK